MTGEEMTVRVGMNYVFLLDSSGLICILYYHFPNVFPQTLLFVAMEDISSHIVLLLLLEK